MKNKIIILMLVVVILGLSSYGLVSYFDYVSTKSKDTHKEIWENLDVNDLMVRELFAMTGSSSKNLFVNTDYENIYFNNSEIEINKMDIKFKLMLILYNLEQESFVQEDNLTIIKEEIVKKKYDEIFGDSKYKPHDFFAGCPSEIKYNKNKAQYEYDEYCGEMQISGHDYKLVEARKYTEHIEIYSKFAFYLIDENKGSVSYWKNCDISGSIMTLTLDQTFDIEAHLDALNTYKYTFKLKDGYYYFEKVEKLK